MKILIGQPLHEDKIEQLENEIKSNKDIDFVLFPEGYLLCMEILKGRRDLEKVKEHMDFIVHPIGVGMFCDEQFELWISEAQKIAKAYNTMIIGTSHADGSYRNCGVSLPISYFIDSNGEAIYISKSDTRTRIVDLTSKKVVIKAINGVVAEI